MQFKIQFCSADSTFLRALCGELLIWVSFVNLRDLCSTNPKFPHFLRKFSSLFFCLFLNCAVAFAGRDDVDQCLSAKISGKGF
jgi:hypothetical protein